MLDTVRRLSLLFVGLVALAAGPGLGALPAMAQQDGAPDGADAPKQVALTQAQIDNLLAAQKDIAAAQPSEPPKGDQPDAKVQARLEAAAKKHGFSGLDAYGAVFDSVGIVVAGIDPSTKTYVGPAAIIKKQMAQVEADKSLAAKDRAQALSDLKEALQAAGSARPLPGNVDLVVKNYDRLSSAFQGSE